MTLKHLPKITIVTIVRNAQRTITKAIESLIAQAYPNLEYIVLDGASTDGTVNIIKQYESHISYWQSKPDRGPDYNEGVALAHGDLIAFLNGDDWYEPGILNAVGNLFAQDPSLELITGGARFFQEHPNGSLTETTTYFGDQLKLTMKNAIYNPITNAQFFNRSVFEKYGPINAFDETGHHRCTSDKEHFIRLLSHRIKQKDLQQIAINYRQHPGSTSFAGYLPTVRRAYLEHLDIAEKYLSIPELFSKKELRTLKKWHTENAVRAVIRDIWAGEQKQAYIDFKRALRIYLK